MKTLFLFIISSAIFISTAIAQDAKLIIKGQITDTLLINTYENPIGRQKKFARYELDAASKNEHAFEIPDSLCNKRLYLSYNKTFTFIELNKGQTLMLDVDGQKLKFKNDNSKVNQYLYDWCNLYIKSFPNALEYRFRIKNFFANSKATIPTGVENNDVLNKISGLNEKATKHLLNYGISDSRFVNQQKIWTKYLEERMLIENYGLIKYQKKDFSTQYKQTFSQIEFNDVDILQHPDANEMLSKLFTIHEDVLDKKRVIPNLLKDRANELKHDELRERYVLSELNKLVISQNIFLLDEVANNITPFVKSNEGKEQLETMKSTINKLVLREMRGKDAFEFKFADTDGKMVKMSDFRGKYVFIDVWATWCAPCNINIPYLNKIEEELEGKNIAFVSISIDKPEQRQKWIDFLNKTHIGGTALIANNAFKDDMCKYYGINAIPRFMLIDPNGKIISAHCRQPIDVGFRNYLVQFITEKSK